MKVPEGVGAPASGMTELLQPVDHHRAGLLPPVIEHQIVTHPGKFGQWSGVAASSIADVRRDDEVVVGSSQHQDRCVADRPRRGPVEDDLELRK